MGDGFPRRKLCKIQPAPAMHTDSTQKPQHAIGFMFPVWPQPRKAHRKFCIG